MDPADLAEARRLMQLEYETAIETVANYDNQRGWIKGWAITVAGAFLALAVNSHSRPLGVIAATSVVFFASIDIMYMAVEQKIIDRSHELERYLEAARRGHIAIADSYRFGIGPAHGRKYSWRKVLGALLHRPQIVVFYGGLAIGAGVATALMP